MKRKDTESDILLLTILINQNEDTATKTTCIFIGTSYTGATLPQHDKFCTSGNASDHNGLSMCLRWIRNEFVEYGWVKLLEDIHLEDQGRDGRMTVRTSLTKIVRMGGG